MNGGPAFPVGVAEKYRDIEGKLCLRAREGSEGMFLLDYFAGQALSHFDSAHHLPSEVGDAYLEQQKERGDAYLEQQKERYVSYINCVAQQCYDMAEAMLRARENLLDKSDRNP